MISIHPAGKRRNRRALSPIDEHARIRALPAVRMLTGRGLPLATAILTAEAFGLYTGGDR